MKILEFKNFDIGIREQSDFDLLDNLIDNLQKLSSPQYSYNSLIFNDLILINRYFNYKYVGKISHYKQDINPWFDTIRVNLSILNKFIKYSNIYFEYCGRSPNIYFKPEITTKSLKSVNKIINTIKLIDYTPTEDNIFYINKLFDIHTPFRSSVSINIKQFKLIFEFVDNIIIFNSDLFNGIIPISEDKSKLVNYPFFKLMYSISKTDPFEEAYKYYFIHCLENM